MSNDWDKQWDAYERSIDKFYRESTRKGLLKLKNEEREGIVKEDAYVSVEAMKAYSLLCGE